MLHHGCMSEILPASWESLILEWLAQCMPGPGYDKWAEAHLADRSLAEPPKGRIILRGREYDVSNPETHLQLFERAYLANIDNEDIGSRMSVFASTVQRAHLAYRAALYVYKFRTGEIDVNTLREGFRQTVMLDLRGTQFLLRHIGGPEWDRELAEFEDDHPS